MHRVIFWLAFHMVMSPCLIHKTHLRRFLLSRVPYNRNHSISWTYRLWTKLCPYMDHIFLFDRLTGNWYICMYTYFNLIKLGSINIQNQNKTTYLIIDWTMVTSLYLSKGWTSSMTHIYSPNLQWDNSPPLHWHQCSRKHEQCHIYTSLSSYFAIN